MVDDHGFMVFLSKVGIIGIGGPPQSMIGTTTISMLTR